jgi:hypothetical protein
LLNSKAVSLFICSFIALSSITNEAADASKDLQTCHNSQLQVEFACDPQWPVQYLDDAILMVISADPNITQIIARIETNFIFLEQLTKEELVKKERYAPGFSIEHIDLWDRPTLKVKAFAKNDLSKRILDYYFIDDKKLYGVLFTVSPKEVLDSSKFFIENLVHKVNFVHQKE